MPFKASFKNNDDFYCYSVPVVKKSKHQQLSRSTLYEEKACSPVIALPRIRACMSWVPS